MKGILILVEFQKIGNVKLSNMTQLYQIVEGRLLLCTCGE